MHSGDLDGVAWGELSHAYGPATDLPSLLRGLRGPEAGECLSELYGSITHQGTRYDATPACVPFLVDVAGDPAVVDRTGVLLLVHFAAVGFIGEDLDWVHQRDRQVDADERRSWDAVVAERPRLRALLADGDRSVARAALVVLAWTGDDDPVVLGSIAAAHRGGDDVDQATAWMASVVLGRLPSGIDPPTDVQQGEPALRFASAVAALRFGGERTSSRPVDELCSVFESVDAGEDLTDWEFLTAEVPERIAASALVNAPPHLHGHVDAQLLTAIGRGSVLGVEPLEAFLRLHVGAGRTPLDRDHLSSHAIEALAGLVPALTRWREIVRIPELDDVGLPSTARDLAAWLGVPEERRRRTAIRHLAAWLAGRRSRPRQR